MRGYGDGVIMGDRHFLTDSSHAARMSQLRNDFSIELLNEKTVAPPKGGLELLHRQIRHGYIIGHVQGGVMRPRVLAASMSLVLILSGRVVVQTVQNRPPDHDHPAVGLPGVRQLAVKPFTTLPKGVLFLRLENFSTTDDPVAAIIPDTQPN